MEAVTTAGAHGHAAAAPKRFSNGLLGVIFFLCSETTLFGSLIFADLYLRRIGPMWPPHGEERLLDIGIYPVINTAVLITSGFTQHFAHRAIRRGEQSKFIGLSIVTIILGTWFVSGQAWEYAHVKLALSRNTYGGTFFTLTGLHGAHVSFGILFLIYLLIGSLRGKYNQYHHFPIEAGTLYWHFVDAVWVLLFSLFYLL